MSQLANVVITQMAELKMLVSRMSLRFRERLLHWVSKIRGLATTNDRCLTSLNR